MKQVLNINTETWPSGCLNLMGKLNGSICET